MKFRAKVFLAVLLPSALLVSATLAVALAAIQARSRERSIRDFERARTTLGIFIGQRTREMMNAVAIVSGGARLRGMITDADENGEIDALKASLADHFSVTRIEPEFYAIRGRKKQLLVRYSKWHDCSAACAHAPEEEDWVAPDVATLGCADGRPILATALPYRNGVIVWGRDMLDCLAGVHLSQELEISLFDAGGRQLYGSAPGVPGRVPAEADIQAAGVHYRVDTDTKVEGEKLRSALKVVLLSPMTREDDERRVALVTAGVTLLVSVGLAAIVSTVFSRGISRPVETLVAATERVAGGDYRAHVEIPGRDEIADLGAAFNAMTEGLRKRREIMEKTLSRDVADQLMKNVDLGGERREVTILFMDVRGFTSTTEGMDPADVVEMLNGVLDRLAEAIAINHGNVNKYLGDGIMAMFGAPKPDPDHAINAVHAAIAMQRAIGAWTADRVKAGKGGLRIGIGVNTGLVLAGNVGSRQRLEYTLIGEEVNLTSRICGKAGPGQIYITHTTLERLGGKIPTKTLDPINVKGLSYPVPVYLVEA